MKSMTVRGTGDPPPMAKRSADRLKESKSDTCVRAVHMAGTMNWTVTWWSAIACSVARGSKDGMMTLVPPT
jgi:hypothetical protein